MSFGTYVKEIWRGKDLYRTLMNYECMRHLLSGDVLDLGSGLNSASYHRFFKNNNAHIISIDGQHQKINFEKDPLPYTDESIDTVLTFNLFEHIYRYSFLLKEIKRVLKPNGRIIGAVPFLIGYHADPHDYFRYTTEALEKIFSEQDVNNINITVIGRGPFSAAYAQVEFVFPRLCKLFILPFCLFADKLFFLIKPALPHEKFALGLFFTVIK